MDKASVLADLRGIFGRKILLSPADIADVIEQSVGAQAVARHRGKFDIPLTPRGRGIYVSIYDLADWLSGETQSSRKAKTPPQGGSATGGSRRASNRPSLGKILMFLKAEITFKESLYAALEAKALDVDVKHQDDKKSKTLPRKKT